MADLSHLDDEGRAHMVDVGAKEPTRREAEAEAVLVMSEPTRRALFGGELPKGDAIGVARVAGIMAAKRTSDMIPLCHPLPLSSVSIDIAAADVGARIVARVATTAPTGVEMEALAAVSVAALTLYDMIKGVERGSEVRSIRLLYKSGGRSGTWQR